MSKLMLKTGEYTDKTGTKKGRYTNVGRILQNDKGMFIKLDGFINYSMFAGDDKSVLLSVFEDEQKPAKSDNVAW